MKPSINDILEGLDAERIGIDESFSFHCTQCGKCCQNRSDILLNPLDLYQAAKALNISILKFVKDFCEAFPGENSLFPIIRLLPRGESKTCPMLKDNKCIIHHAKPTVCAMYPIGRGILMGSHEHSWDLLGEDRIEYIFSKPNCGDTTESHTVREWLEQFGIPLDNEFFVKWCVIMRDVSACIEVLFEKEQVEEIVHLVEISIFKLYLDYDLEQEFMEQFEKNINEVRFACVCTLPEERKSINGGNI